MNRCRDFAGAASDAEQADIVAFLNSLNGGPHLVAPPLLPR